MAEDDETNPEVIRTYTAKICEQQEQAAIQIRACLTSELHKTNLVLEGDRLYHAGVRAVYSALCLLTLEGREHLDPREIQEFKKGIEDYLTGAGR